MDKDTPQGEIQLQVENITTCSARCVFCTYPQVMSERAGQSMPMDLYRKIVDDMATIPQITTLKITGLSEPTLDPLLEERVAYSKKKAPNVLTQIYTHGAHLTPKRHDSLRAAGLDSIVVSLNAVRAEQHEAVMGLKGKFDIVCRNIDYAIANRNGRHVEVHAVCNEDTFNRQDVIDFSLRWGHASAGGFGLCVWEGNWTGDTRTVRDFTPNKCCFRATSQIYVTYDGKVTPCCFMPLGNVSFGDLNTQTIRDVYNNNPHLNFREKHAADRADEFEYCKTCTRI